METPSSPRLFAGVMISSTFKDLKEHRAALIRAINAEELKHVAMENDSAKLIDVIESSLRMVRDASAYIGLISHKYGQIPDCPERNPKNLSLTELEFNEATRLNRPILLFIMGDEHKVRPADVETDPAKIAKLNEFREQAKRMGPDSKVHRVYATFDSLEEFTQKAIHAVAELRRFLDQGRTLPAPPQILPAAPERDPVPAPPAFYPEPPYIGSHEFVGRRAELERLSDWALAADPHPALLFEAIGGSGKSMLTWQWTTKHATLARQDWAGRFWYSFYERGAIMADFCRRALAYITGQPLDSFKKIKLRNSPGGCCIIFRPGHGCSSSTAWSACLWHIIASTPLKSRTKKPIDLRTRSPIATLAPLSAPKTTNCSARLPPRHPPNCSSPRG